jgi:5-methylcytosine-specific restriction endonuclease McrA
MKHVELASELMLSCHYGDVIHKKQILDQAMSEKGVPASPAKKAYLAAKAALNRTFRMFPDLRQTRFVQVSDFYSLVVLIHKLEREGCILNLPSRNRVAWVFLSSFGANVDRLRELYKKGAKIPPELELYRSYLQTVTEGTDTSHNRKLREKILRELIGSQFKKKDTDRIFSQEQRRIIWNLSKNHRCALCNEELQWGSFTVDHVKPHSRGGKTITLNACLMHHKCNSKKGAR